MTTEVYDLYGSKSLDLEELSSAVEKALGMVLQRHESSYLGGDYFVAGDPRDEEIVVQKNDIGDEGTEELAEPQFDEYPILLRVNASTRGDEIRERLLVIAGVDFLRRSVA
jgi:hypothetical protein